MAVARTIARWRLNARHYCEVATKCAVAIVCGGEVASIAWYMAKNRGLAAGG